MFSVRFQGKSFTITVIQVYAPTSNAEEAQVECFNEDLQELLELTPKKNPFHHKGLECQSRRLFTCSINNHCSYTYYVAHSPLDTGIQREVTVLSSWSSNSEWRFDIDILIHQATLGMQRRKSELSTLFKKKWTKELTAGIGA